MAKYAQGKFQPQFPKKYVGNKVNIKLNDELFNNLNYHYTNFINKLL